MDNLKKGLSVLINTKNEEENIEDCIRSVSGLADELIVVDMKSKDKTVGIARALGASVFEVSDVGWVEPVRNLTLGKASYSWILLLDADERVPKTLIKKIKEIIKEEKYDVVKFPRKDIFFGKWIKHAGWWPDYQVRLFKKGFVKWEVKIHPEVKFRGKILELEPKEQYAIVHENARNLQTWLRKIDIYTSKESYLFKQKNLSPERLINYMEKEFVRRYFDGKGYLDGMHGFVLCKSMEFYKFLELAKFWEKTGYKQIVSNSQLKEVLENGNQLSAAKVESLEEELNKLAKELKTIKSSRVYRSSLVYYRYRDMITNIFKRK